MGARVRAVVAMEAGGFGVGEKGVWVACWV